MPPKKTKEQPSDIDNTESTNSVIVESTIEEPIKNTSITPEIMASDNTIDIPTIVDIPQLPTVAEDFQLPISERNVRVLCDKCYLEKRCPKYTEGGECVYNLEVNIDKNTDMITVAKRLLNIQAERVFRASIIEKTDGGAMDGNLSEEIDRYMDMLQRFKDLGDYRDTIEIKATGSGILSKIFGRQV